MHSFKRIKSVNFIYLFIKLILKKNMKKDGRKCQICQGIQQYYGSVSLSYPFRKGELFYILKGFKIF